MTKITESAVEAFAIELLERQGVGVHFKLTE